MKTRDTRRVAVVLLFSAFAAAGCARALGYAGAHPGYVKCTGKGSVTGTGTIALGAGVGGAGTNMFTIQADCGPGFTFEQGMVPAGKP